MAYTLDLAVLGPAIGASLAAVYAVRTAKLNIAVQLHNAHVDKRMDVANLFMDAVDAFCICEEPAAQAKASRAIERAKLRVHMAFADYPDAETAAERVARWADMVTRCPMPPSTGIDKAQSDLRDLAHREEFDVGDKGPFDAREAVTFVDHICMELDLAAEKGEEGPDPDCYRDALHHLERELGIDLTAVLLPALMRRAHWDQVKAHRTAQVELLAAQHMFANATNSWMINPPHLNPSQSTGEWRRALRRARRSWPSILRQAERGPRALRRGGDTSGQ